MLKKRDALHEWEREFGDIEKVTDFSGRKIARSAYNNNHSKFGWTVVCILPESEGGTYMTHNMICCNIETYREKAESFPRFKANGYSFIVKAVGCEYRILLNNAENEGFEKCNQIQHTDFRKGEEGVKFWHTCENTEISFFTGYAKINISTSNFGKLMLNRFRIFIEKIFEIPVTAVKQDSDRHAEFTIISYNLATREDTRDFLSKCIIFNTYATFYLRETVDCRINIYCGMKEYNINRDFSAEKIKKEIVNMETDYIESFAIDELIEKNTGAGRKQNLERTLNGFYKYNRCYKELRNELVSIQKNNF